MNIKTINLTGSEVAIKVGGGNSEIRNNGTETIYASAASGIVAGADGVVSIPAGASVTVRDTRGTVYILGTGSVEVVGKDDAIPVFKSAAAAGGIGDNLLINPNFLINQRGQSYYEGTSYSVDRWRGYHGNEKVNVTQDGITVEVINNQQLCTFIDTPVSAGTALCASIRWRLVKGSYSSVSIIGINENGYELIASANNNSAEEVTTICAGVAQSDYSSLLFSFGGDGTVKPYWAKLEIGSVATPFCPPDPATELMKCQRYYQLRSTGDIAAVDMRPSMRTITDIKQREDGLYEYIAEI